MASMCRRQFAQVCVQIGFSFLPQGVTDPWLSKEARSLLKQMRASNKKRKQRFTMANELDFRALREKARVAREKCKQDWLGALDRELDKWCTPMLTCVLFGYSYFYGSMSNWFISYSVEN